MSSWPSAKARRVLAASLKIGWWIKRERDGSHKPGRKSFILIAPTWSTSAWADAPSAFTETISLRTVE